MIHTDVYVTSAFTKDNGGGNRAGVVLNHPELTVTQKMKIAERMGYSETAFVTESDRADYCLEYYTPTDEVPLCGHATIAAFATMEKLGMLGRRNLTIETKAGILKIHVDEDGLVMMEQNRPEYLALLREEQLKPVMGPGYEGTGDPIQIVTTGLHDVILPVRDVELLHALRPDLEKMCDFSRQVSAVGIHAFAVPEGATEVDAVCRDFAPLIGIPEESATGTANCALAGYFFRHKNRKKMYIFEQGYALDQPSRIAVRLEYEEDRIHRIFVGGYGNMVEKVALELS